MKIDLNKKSPVTASDSFNLLFGDAPSEKKDIQLIAISQLIPYPNQPFRLYTPDRLQELADDISLNGILSPVIVRPLNSGYQILAGHNRVKAAAQAGLEEIPCIIRGVDDDMAKLILVNTNLNQRQELLSSEKAYAYKIQLESLNNQGKRSQDHP